MKDYLEINVVRFISLLRHAGIRIGSGEVVDALNALALLDLSDRDAVKASLKATLVKRPGDQAIFEKAFNAFFAPPDAKDKQNVEYKQKLEDHRRQLDKADEDLVFQGTTLELSDKEKIVYAGIPEKDKEKLLNYINKTSSGKNVEQRFKPLLENVVKSSLSYWRKNLREELDLNDRPQTGDEEIDALVDAVDSGEERLRSLRDEDMQNIADKDLPKAQALVRKMARQMVAGISRRYRQINKHKQLDLRRSIRHNICFGGTMFRLRYRSRRIQKPKLILLCDVSGSMVRYADFVMQFIYGINTVVGSIESFVFSENLEHITEPFRQGTSFSSVMPGIVSRSAEWGRGTNLAAALRTLHSKHQRILTGSSYVIIVSDTKTMKLDEAVIEVRELKRKVKELIWLNTLPQQEWEHARTTAILQKEVKMYPCNTLSELESVIRERIIR